MPILIPLDLLAFINNVRENLPGKKVFVNQTASDCFNILDLLLYLCVKECWDGE